MISRSLTKARARLTYTLPNQAKKYIIIIYEKHKKDRYGY